MSRWHSLLRASLLMATASLLLCIAGPAGATGMSTRAVPCPLDSSPSKVQELQSNNRLGGHDSDLCSYSSDGQWREYALTTCPKDLFTLLSADFQGPFDEASIRGFKDVAETVHTLYPDPDRVETWDRYAIAARFYRVLGRDEAFLGDLYLSASWTARDRAVGLSLALEGPVAARKLLDAGAKELEKQLPLKDRKSVLYNLARVAERFGDPALRDHYIDSFVSAAPMDPAETKAIALFREMTGDVETRFQDLAIQEFEKYLRRSSIPARTRVQVSYQLADLYRRRARELEAIALFKGVLADASTPVPLREMATFLVRELEDR